MIKLSNTSNPVILVKNGIAFPLERMYQLEKPFSFQTVDGKSFEVAVDQDPVYFLRKRMRVSGKGQVKEHYIHRICVGAKTRDGEIQKNWVFPDGNFDVTGETPSS
jgi:hypothetical protein